ncbi:hypothetical protein B0O99DRAFT_337419 [Bisporella sp. PMI_857]|nr:hypothetical protein B0O99DRAFT_337419 [Bisporella sp. PMI_857]
MMIEEVEQNPLRSEFFLLSLCYKDFVDKTYSSLFQALSAAGHVTRAQTKSGALQYLNRRIPSAILATDEGLTLPENKPVLDKVIAYVKNGGLVILGLHLPNFATWKSIDKLFADFDIPWKTGDYASDTFELHKFCMLERGMEKKSLPAEYSMKAVHVRNARPSEKIYVRAKPPDEDEDLLISLDMHVGYCQAAIVGTKVGSGFLVYHGDVNPGLEFDRVITALCGVEGMYYL